MVSFNEIAVIVLATSQGRYAGTSYSQYETRLVPLASTWGSLFPELYMIMGRNEFDIDFVTRSCTLESSWQTIDGDRATTWSRTAEAQENGRRLVPSAPQGPLKDELDIFHCPRNSTVAPVRPVKVMMSHRCTGEYFGAGPTCRAEEAMLAFLKLPALKHTKWLFFIDDDIYVRPHALRAYLTGSPAGKYGGAVLFNPKRRTLAYAWRRVSHNCTNIATTGFYFGQPAVLSRALLERMRPAMDRLGMRSLQQFWGGSHDAILGLFIFLHNSTVWSLSNHYIGHEILTGPPERMLSALKKEKHFVFHKVRNVPTGREGKGPRLPSQWDLFKLLHDDSTHPNVIVQQERVGEEAVRTAAGAVDTADPHRLSRWDPQQPELFRPEMCNG